MRRGIDRRGGEGRRRRRRRKGTGTIDACMSYRRGPNCLPTGDVEPRAEDLFLRGWDREGRGVETRITMRHASIGSSRERKRFSRRSVLAALWYYLLLGDVEANSPQGKFSFSFFLFFSLFCFTMAISGKVTFFSSSLSFLPFFPIRYDRNWPRSKILSNLRSFLLHLRYCETIPPLPTTNRATIYGKIDKRLVCGTIDGVGSTAVFFFSFFFRGRL